MKIVALFNTVSSENIGLENFMRQRSDMDRCLLAVKQEYFESLTSIEELFHETTVTVLTTDNYLGSSMLGALRKLGGMSPIVIHSHHTQATVLGAFFRCFRKSRLMVTAHNDFNHYNLKQKFVFGLSFLLCDRIICNSEGTRKSLPWYVNRSKMQVIYNGVDFDKIDSVLEANPKRKHGSNAIVIGAVCRLVPQKDLPTLICAFAKAVGQSKQELRLRLVGDGEQRGELEDLIQDLGLKSAIDLTGSVSRVEVYKNLVEMDIFVVSSRWEGFCNAMVEAAAAGKAIISSDIEPLPEVIGRENAAFFEVGNSDALCEKILALAGDEDRRKQLAQKGRNFVRGRYSLDVSAKRYGEVYDELCKEL